MVALLLSCTLVFDEEIDDKVGVADACASTVAYLDADADGFGSTSLDTGSCDVPDGYAASAGDCDDADAAVNPGAAEFCNGVDDDCNGITDDDSATDATTWYTDSDGDGYGTDESVRTACSQPSGTVSQGGDCDDALASVNPAAEETDCADPVDYNCDGSTGYDDADADGYPACQDCDDRDSANTVPGTWYADDDGDGHGNAALSETACVAPDGHVSSGDDCDDAASTTYPGASELCDDVDNDCNAATLDDDALGATWYADTDGDGFGNATATVVACDQPGGFVADNTDCDDSAITAYPGGTETCDDLDNDCDSTVDEDDAADAPNWYADTDGDSYGTADSTWVACDAPAGFVADGEDCDDGDAGVNPGAAEVCENGVDEDCDGGAGECELASGTLEDVASAAFEGSEEYGYAGYYVAGAGDVNGDGFDDVLVGNHGHYLGDSGEAYLVLGAATVTGGGLASVGIAFSAESSGVSAGWGLSSAGDFNGDGRGDFVVLGNASGDTYETAAYLILGSSAPSAGNLGDSDAVFSGESGTRALLVTGSPDFNGDGFGDVLVGDYQADEAGEDAGAAYLVLGSTTPGDFALSAADARWEGEAAGDAAGWNVASGGDTNGDGVSDFLVGAYGHDTGSASLGAVYVVLGSASPGDMSLAAADAVFTGENWWVGPYLAGGQDVDGDGLDDLLIGSTLEGAYQEGAAYLVRGSAAPSSLGLGSADAKISGEWPYGYFGAKLAMGDLDGDEHADLVLGSDVAPSGCNVAVFWGATLPAAADTAAADACIGEMASYDSTMAVAGVGDFDGDGFADALIGYMDGASTSTGAAYLILGTGY